LSVLDNKINVAIVLSSGSMWVRRVVFQQMNGMKNESLSGNNQMPRNPNEVQNKLNSG